MTQINIDVHFKIYYNFDHPLRYPAMYHNYIPLTQGIRVLKVVINENTRNIIQNETKTN